MLVPKAEELVANPYRHGGKDGREGASSRTASGASSRAPARPALADFPITVYYAFKQSDASEDGDGVDGLGDAARRDDPAGLGDHRDLADAQRAGQPDARGRHSNALASSIVLALRPRPDDAPTTDRRGLIAALQAELPDALRKLQQGAIAPVDLPQAAIGPGWRCSRATRRSSRTTARR